MMTLIQNDQKLLRNKFHFGMVKRLTNNYLPMNRQLNVSCFVKMTHSIAK